MTSRPLVWHGVLTRLPSLRAKGALLLAPGVLWLTALVILPTIALAGVAFLEPSSAHVVEWRGTWENLLQAIGFVPEGWDSTYLTVMARTFWIALVTSVIAVSAAFPVAFFIARQPRARRYAWLSLFILPLCTNTVVRSYAWILVLHRESLIVRALAAIGLVGQGDGIYPGSLAVYLGLVSNALPFALLPLYAAVERLDWSLVDAAVDLKAGRLGVFRHAILPQTAPALSVALIFTFVPTLGTYVISDLLGAGKYTLVGNVIAQQFGPSSNWPFGSAVSMFLIVCTVATLLLYRRVGRGGELL